MTYIKNTLTFTGALSLTEMQTSYHLDLYINDTLINTESEINSALHPNGITDNPDKIEYRCKTGYSFSGDVYGRYKNKEGTNVTVQFIVENGIKAYCLYPQSNGTKANRIYPYYKSNFTKDGVSTPYCTVVDSADGIPVITSLNNCILSPVVSTIPKGSASNFTITANNGFKFTSTPSVYTLAGDVTSAVQVTKVSDYEYTFSITPAETDESLNIHADASAIAEPSSIPLEKNLTNCSLSPDVNSFIDGQTYNIVLTADAGYIFDIAPSFRYKNHESVLVTIPLTKVSDYVYKYDGLTIDTYKAKKFFITAYASIESVSTNKYGVLQIHKIDADTLKAFNDLRYYSGSGSLSQIDLSQYISALKVIFVDANSTVNDNILVSNINTGISAPKINDDYITLDLGNVLLAGMYHNALDKMYSEIFLSLPFVDVYKLDSVYMNETINIKYHVNLISGDGTIFISIVRDIETFLIDVINVNMSFDLPYVQPIESDIKQLNTKIKSVNFNIAPSVTIKQRLKADANNNIYKCFKIDTPANENGYFKIERLDADTIPASANIRNKIENLLKAGVYI